MKKILVPTDFSKQANIATEVAADVARRSGADLVLLHVVEEVTGGSFNVEGEVSSSDIEDRLFNHRLLEKARRQLEKAVLDPSIRDVNADGLLRVGNPFHGIRTLLQEKKFDLVVMGTAGHTKLEEMLIGTNTERVVRLSKCPVLTIHKKPATSNFKNIVYATAMDKDEEVFSRIVRRTQQLYNSNIHLVRINTPGDFQRDYEVKDYMNRFAKKLGLKNYTISVYNDMNVEEGVIRFADSIDADLIAMATHGRTGFAHVIAGSVAEDVVGHAKRPVLTFVVKR
ncbi:MAG TPA: universal stress protein [Cyclobacteriaceae bacterium]|nr:universal stress protein [Cyclobacteriaceae bacterium]